jgi:hypothetical protein
VFGRNLQWQPVRGSEHPRGLPLVTRMQELQAEEQRRESQWHPRVCKLPSKNAQRTNYTPMGLTQHGRIHGGKRAPYDEWIFRTLAAILCNNAFSVATQFTVSTDKRVNFREECYWSHACKSFKRTCVGSNGILECKFLSENAHRTEVVSWKDSLSNGESLQCCDVISAVAEFMVSFLEGFIVKR